MLDYDMIASTNWIPFMYIPNPSETALPAPASGTARRR